MAHGATVRAVIRSLVLSATLLGALPAAAGAHAIVTVDAGTIVYSARDATDRNTLSVSLDENRVRLLDTTVEGGIAPGPCDPGRVDGNGYIIEVFCPRSASSRLRVDVADREDSVDVSAPLPAVILGGPGADTLTGGPANDEIDGGEGDDRLSGGGGDDAISARDGATDTVSCGDGADRVTVDAPDAVDATCEAVDRATDPGAGGPGAGGPSTAPVTTGRDVKPPRVRGGALTFQRIGRRRSLRIYATSSEVGRLAVSATVRVGEQQLRLGSGRGRVDVAGGGAALTLRLSRTTWTRLRRALRGGRRLRATVTVVATDRAGNSSASRLPAITLAR
jgi:hypothetical protein